MRNARNRCELLQVSVKTVANLFVKGVLSEWEDFSKHEVVSMEQVESNVKQLVPPKNVTLYCYQHQGKELDLYCDTCEELICLHCTIKKHQYDLVEDTFERYKAEITTSLESVEIV